MPYTWVGRKLTINNKNQQQIAKNLYNLRNLQLIKHYDISMVASLKNIVKLISKIIKKQHSYLLIFFT